MAKKGHEDLYEKVGSLTAKVDSLSEKVDEVSKDVKKLTGMVAKWSGAIGLMVSLVVTFGKDAISFLTRS